MLKSVIGAIAVVAGTMLVPTLGQACEGGKVLLEDKFDKLNPAWGFTLDAATEKLDANGLSADAPPNYYRRALSQLSYYTDYVACATFTTVFTCTNTSQCESQPYVGIVVLAGDSKNFYTFEVSPSYNTYSLSRVQNNKWLYPIGWTAMPDNKKFATGEKIELEAAVKGSNMKFKVNGKQVLEFEGVAPDGGSLVGFELSTFASDTKNSRFQLSNFTVKELQ
jgi:hypothetical protein